MLTLLSPAKTLDYDTPPITRRKTMPQLLDRAEQLVADARQMNPDEIRKLMGVSESIAELNHQRFMNWHPDFSLDNAKQAVLAFRGDVYSGLDADSLTTDELAFAQKHLRILSGLYGLLRPLDLMQPYRLEMGLKFANRGGKNLYEFWGDEITQLINKQLRSSGSDVLVNLASNEYFKSVKPKQLAADIVTPVFKDKKGDTYKIISFYAKKARGLMARHIICEGINEPEQLKTFASEGYRYSAEASTPDSPVFLRDSAP